VRGEPLADPDVQLHRLVLLRDAGLFDQREQNRCELIDEGTPALRLVARDQVAERRIAQRRHDAAVLKDQRTRRRERLISQTAASAAAVAAAHGQPRRQTVRLAGTATWTCTA